MKLSEFIKKLEKLMEDCGDVEVGVQFRDEGDVYKGVDLDVDPYFTSGGIEAFDNGKRIHFDKMVII